MFDKFLRLRQATPTTENVPTRLFLSENSKTGLSINVSIAKSCRPTSACMQYCYGLEARIRLAPALQRQVDNFNRFEYLEHASKRELVREALGLAYEIQARQSFIRFFGVGDLQPGSVRFINLMAQEVPDLAIWVSTRKFDLAAKLLHLPNLNVMLSLDSSTKEVFRRQAYNLVGEHSPQFFLAWVRQEDEDPPPDFINVVFDEHHQGKRAAFETPDPRACPATAAGGMDHTNACEKCRFCFTPERRTTSAGKLRHPLENPRRSVSARRSDDRPASPTPDIVPASVLRKRRVSNARTTPKPPAK